MKNADPEYVIIGKIGATYGIKGWLKVTSFTETTTHILNYSPWYLMDGKNWNPVNVEDSREHGKSVVVKLNGFNNPEKARLLTGKTIAVRRSQLPTLRKHAYYWTDLEGLTVINQDGQTLGKIMYLIATGSNDVLVVKGDKEIAIPYLPDEVVTAINLDQRVMHVKWEVI